MHIKYTLGLLLLLARLHAYLGSKVHNSIDSLLVEDMPYKISRLDVSFHELQRALRQCRPNKHIVWIAFSNFEGTDLLTLKFGLSCVLWRLRREAQ